MELYVLAGIEMLAVLVVGWRIGRVKPWRERCQRLTQSEHYWRVRAGAAEKRCDQLRIELKQAKKALCIFESHCRYCGQFITTGEVCSECADGEDCAKFGDDGPWDDSTMDELN